MTDDRGQRTDDGGQGEEKRGESKAEIRSQKSGNNGGQFSLAFK